MKPLRLISTACALACLLSAACGEDDDNAGPGPVSDASTDAASFTDSGPPNTPGDAGAGTSDTGVVVEQGTATASGGRSLNGACTPGAGPSVASLGSAYQVLATSDEYFAGPVLDATGVYAGYDEALYRLAPGASALALFLATPGRSYAPVIRGTYMYTGYASGTDPGSPDILERRPLATPDATPMMVASSAAYEQTFDDAYLYTFDRGETGFYRTPFGSTMREPIAPDEQGESLQVHGDYLYFVRWTSWNDQIARIPLAKGPVEVVVDDIDAINLASYVVGEQGIHWSDWHGGHFTAFGTPKTKQTFYRLGNAGGSGLADDLYIKSVVDDRVYWTFSDFPNSSFGWSKVDGSDCAVVLADASAQAHTDGFAYGTRGNFPKELFRVPLTD